LIDEFEEMLLADMNRNNERHNDDDEISEAPARNNRNHQQNISDTESVDFFTHNPLPKRFSEYGKSNRNDDKLIDELHQLADELNNVTGYNVNGSDDDNGNALKILITTMFIFFILLS